MTAIFTVIVGASLSGIIVGWLSSEALLGKRATVVAIGMIAIANGLMVWGAAQ